MSFEGEIHYSAISFIYGDKSVRLNTVYILTIEFNLNLKTCSNQLLIYRIWMVSIKRYELDMWGLDRYLFWCSPMRYNLEMAMLHRVGLYLVDHWNKIIPFYEFEIILRV